MVEVKEENSGEWEDSSTLSSAEIEFGTWTADWKIETKWQAFLRSAVGPVQRWFELVRKRGDGDYSLLSRSTMTRLDCC